MKKNGWSYATVDSLVPGDVIVYQDKEVMIVSLVRRKFQFNRSLGLGDLYDVVMLGHCPAITTTSIPALHAFQKGRQ